MAERLPTVVIDPGHGGSDKVGGSSANNATGPNGLLEKDVALDLARRTAGLLGQSAEVLMTRTRDINLSLADRARLAHDRVAALFLSIHLNGFGDASVDGTEVWIARQANQESRDFATEVLHRLIAVTNVSDRGVRERDLGVLLPERHAAHTGACLAEIAFLTNPAEARRLESDDYRQAIAQALAAAVQARIGVPAAAGQAVLAGAYSLGSRRPAARTTGFGSPPTVPQSQRQPLGGRPLTTIPASLVADRVVVRTDRHHGTARPSALDTDIPLDPGNGGMSIDESALQIGDIIVSTTPALISRAIRVATGAPVSHALIYIGGSQVVEAIGEGVVLRSLAESVAASTVAVAFRVPDLTSDEGLRVRDFVGKQIGLPYNRMGIVRQAAFQLDRAVFCHGKTGDDYTRCVNWVGRVDMGTPDNSSFFCSELVLAAFADAGVPLVTTPPGWGSPGDIADLRLDGRLAYVGHLKAPVAGAQSAVRWVGGLEINYSFTYDVPGAVTPIAQPSGMTCWCTVSTMMLGWKDGTAYTIQQAMDKAGASYRQKFDSNQGLAGSEKPAFLAALGLQAEPPADYTIEALLDMLKTYGPLWITTDENPSASFAIHARIVTGMYGDGGEDDTYLRIVDPAGGKRTEETYHAFMDKYDEVARGDIAAGGDLRMQIVHF